MPKKATPEECETILRMYQAGDSYVAMAAAIGRSAGATYNIAQRLAREYEEKGAPLVRPMKNPGKQRKKTYRKQDAVTMFDGVRPTQAEVEKKTDAHRTKWGAIAKRCEELGLSYGEARARGLL